MLKLLLKYCFWYKRAKITVDVLIPIVAEVLYFLDHLAVKPRFHAGQQLGHIGGYEIGG